MLILTLNCRDDALQYQLYDWDGKKVLAGGAVARGGIRCTTTLNAPGKRARTRERDCRDDIDAITLILDGITDPRSGVIKDLGSIRAVGHRVPHGGERFREPVVIAPETLPLLRETLAIAPGLNAASIRGIEAGRELFGRVPQVALFDTAFHSTLPEVAYLYPLPFKWYEKHRIRRYGFHGYAHLHAAQKGAALLKRPLAECTLVTVHTGEGTSLCLVRGGVSVDTSMGFTPVEGVMMESACGDIDAGIIPFMMQEVGLTPQEIETALAKGSGSIGIAGACVNGPGADKELRRSPRGRLALEMEGYSLRKYLGGYLAVGNPDAIVFSYAEGWADWPARGAALKGVEQFGISLDAAADRAAGAGGGERVISAQHSRIPVLVVPSGEELLVAGAVAQVLGWP